MALRSLSDVNSESTQPNPEVLVEKDFVQGEIPYETVVPGEFLPLNAPKKDAALSTQAEVSNAGIHPQVVEPTKLSQFEIYERAFRHFLGTSTEVAQEGVIFKPKEPTVTWEDLWAHTLKAEGGYANNPLDPGGETKFGISKSAYPNLNIAALTTDDAKAIFKVDYFDKVGGDMLLQINPGVAAHVVDMAFNAGPQTAINLLYDSVHLPRKEGLTPELLERVGRDETAIEDYSKARLTYYSSLYNAPTFIKGWINRVSNLNKVLGTKSGLGGAYAAARDLDVEYLVQNQYGSYRNAQPRFRDLDSTERGYLIDRERLLSPGYERALNTDPATINDTPSSSIGEVFRATESNIADIESRFGLNNLVLKETERAYKLNMEALGLKGDVNPFETGTPEFKTRLLADQINKMIKNNPDVDFPVKSMDAVYANVLEQAQGISGRYDRLVNTPVDSLGGLAHRIGQVLFGYLPAQVIGSMEDPFELAFMLGTGGQVKTATQLAKLTAATFLGEGAIQVGVQGKRKDLGLSYGFAQGLERAIGSSVGVAAIGGLSLGLQKLWKLGSSEAAISAGKLADQVDDFASKQPLTPDSLYLKKEAGDIRELGGFYKFNGYGHDFKAKLQFEKRMGEAAEDLAANKPVRVMQDDIKKFVRNDKQFVSDMMTAIKDSGPDGDILAKKFQEQAKAWDAFKKSQITHTVYSNLDDVEHSMVPLVRPGSNELYTFSSVKDANKFLKSKQAEGLISDYAVDIYPEPNGKGYFLGRSADLEPGLTASGRMIGDDVVEDMVGGIKVRGFKESNDLALAKQFPDHSRIRDFVEPKIVDTPPVYPKDQAVLDAQFYIKQLDEYLTAAPRTSHEMAMSKLITRLEDMDQAHIKAGNKGPAMMDISDTLGVEERVSVRDFINEIKEDSAGLAGMMDCMV